MHLIPRSLLAAAIAALFVCPASSFAQETQRRAGEDQQRAQGRQESLADGQIAAALIIDNQKEIALAELASQQAQNEQVKEFAQKMIEDHKQLVQQLQRYAESAGIPRQQLTLDTGTSGERSRQSTAQSEQDRQSAQRPQDEERTPRRAARPELEQRQRGASQGGVDFVQLKHELANENLRSIRQDLQEKSGAEFDQCYMFGQVMAHMHMADALKVSSKHVSSELEQTLQQGLQKTKQHLEEAKQLAQQLEKSSQ